MDCAVSGDLIDGLAGIGGVHIRVRHPLPEPSARLMDTLGVIVQVDPAAPECERGLEPGTSARRRCPECVRVERLS